MDVIGAVIRVDSHDGESQKVVTNFCEIVNMVRLDNNRFLFVDLDDLDDSYVQRGIYSAASRIILCNSFSYMNGAEMFGKMVGQEADSEMEVILRNDVDLNPFRNIVKQVKQTSYDIMAIGLIKSEEENYKAAVVVRLPRDDVAQYRIYFKRVPPMGELEEKFVTIYNKSLEASKRDLFFALFEQNA